MHIQAEYEEDNDDTETKLVVLTPKPSHDAQAIRWNMYDTATPKVLKDDVIVRTTPASDMPSQVYCQQITILDVCLLRDCTPSQLLQGVHGTFPLAACWKLPNHKSVHLT